MWNFHEIRGHKMQRVSEVMFRLSTIGIASLMALAAHAAYAQEAAAIVIGKTN